jgi:branched-chain amino acid transport system substrate-binding protein
MINDQGGINGRQINFISLDDAYSPPKTVEMVRRLVEQDEVLLVFQTLGTPSNTAIQKYLNAKKVPQLFVATGATKWNDPTGNRGRWVGSRTTRPRRRSTRSTS